VGDVWAEHVAISALLAAYADVVTRRAWTELDDLFDPAAPIRVDTVTAPARELSGPTELGSFVAEAITRFEFFELVILNARLQVDATSEARGRVLITEIRRDGRGEWSQTFGVYHDRYAQRDGRWRFASRRYQSLARTGSDPVFPFPNDFDLAPPGA
jgi:hypothetical protein